MLPKIYVISILQTHASIECIKLIHSMHAFIYVVFYGNIEVAINMHVTKQV